MKKRKIPLVMVLGMILIAVSLLLMGAFQVRIHLGGRQSQDIASKMEALLPERTQGVVGVYADSVMPVLALDGNDYVAMLEIPAYGITLPVADAWDSGKLSYGPARFCGSAYDNSLIIGGADTPEQLGFCDEIDLGTVIRITDMTGAQFFYTVARVDRAEQAQTQWLQTEDYDLTLFCRNTYSMDYIAVRCLSAGN